MNKKQLVTAIIGLASALEVEVVTEGLEVKDLEELHAELTDKKEALEQESANKQEKVSLEFKGPYKRYSNGDVATFDGDVAERILKLKPVVAEKYQPKAEASEE